MNDESMLPEDDRDRRLARRLGEVLDAGRPLDAVRSGTPDRFVDMMLDYRAHHRHETELSGEAPARLWGEVEAHLSAERTPRSPRTDRAAMPRLPLVPAWVYAAAAVVVLAAISWLLFWRVPSPAVVASAGADVVTYTAPDGSAITLRPYSVLYQVAVTESEMRYRLAGEAFFAVSRNPDRIFSVEAGEALVTVLGTRFDVRTWGEGTTVYLEEGSVRLTYVPSGASVVLEPGQRAAVTSADALEPEAGSADEELDWMRSELRFEQRPLRDVLAEMSHHFRVQIEAPDSLLTETLTGRVALDSPAESLEDLGVVLGGRFIMTGQDTYHFVAQ